MPELPEVEHVARALARSITGSRIVAAELRQKRIAPGISASTFNRKLKNAEIISIGRRGKFILIHFHCSQVLTVHLRMTGKFLSLEADDKLPQYAHVIFYLGDGRRIVFCDMRQFGRMRILPITKLGDAKELARLAPEPLSKDFTFDYLRNVLKRSRRQLKQLLLDQTSVLGLGNIYAAEALFLARVSPFTVAQKLSSERTKRLHQAIVSILNEAINLGSTLKIDLADGGASYFGSSERFWRVYEREGEPCINCGTKIRRVAQAGRSTYYCPKCQRR